MFQEPLDVFTRAEELTSIEGGNSSNPLIAVSSQRIVILVPVLNELLELSPEGELKRRVQVLLPDGADPQGITSMFLTADDRLVLTAYSQPDPETHLNKGPRAISLDLDGNWQYLTPEHDQRQTVVGVDGDRVVVLFEEDLTLNWVEWQ